VNTSRQARRLARIIALATHYLGDAQAAYRWLKRPNAALGSRTPIELLGTEPGALAVENALGRIAYDGIS
jgi:putative toxin-antitoxin system antitoxin component (TIGR02293 family)